MKRKPRSNSILHGLTPEQRERVDGWLFEENLSYARVVERCGEELGVRVSPTSARRYYERECLARSLEGIKRNAAARKEVATTLTANTEEDYQIALGMAGQLASAEALKPNQHADIERVAGATRLLIAARKEQLEKERVQIQAQRAAQSGRRVALAEKRFQFDAALECWDYLKEMKVIMANDALGDSAKVMAIRERLFGPDLPE
ncbi:MAG: hypothetical protein JWR26_4349 [Pedosphaera sp.]|nr:hypothetical protein [Pedosphaera sp.]